MDDSFQAEKLANARSTFIMGLEEIDLPATTIVQLSIAREGAPPNLPYQRASTTLRFGRGHHDQRIVD